MRFRRAATPPGAGRGCRAAPRSRSGCTSTGSNSARGDVWDLRQGEIVFARPIVKESVSRGRWMAMYLGLFGSYRLNEAVDIEYSLGGEPKLAADVEILD